MATSVRYDPDRSVFEIEAGETVVGMAAYRMEEDRIVFTHTEVDDGHEGEGLGSTLVRSALDEARATDHKVVPLCPFVASWIEHHPDYADLVDRDLTARLTG